MCGEEEYNKYVKGEYKNERKIKKMLLNTVMVASHDCEPLNESTGVIFIMSETQSKEDIQRYCEYAHAYVDCIHENGGTELSDMTEEKHYEEMKDYIENEGVIGVDVFCYYLQLCDCSVISAAVTHEFSFGY